MRRMREMLAEQGSHHGSGKKGNAGMWHSARGQDVVQCPVGVCILCCIAMHGLAELYLTRCYLLQCWGPRLCENCSMAGDPYCSDGTAFVSGS